MTTPQLEERLSRLADELVAPATPEIRSAIGHRARVLRRQRRTRQAAGAGILVLAAVAGLVAVARDTTPEAQTNWSDVPTSVLPAIVPGTDGWAVVMAEDTTIRALQARSLQVFEPPDDPDRARIILRHTLASDAIAEFPDESNEQVTIGGSAGYLVERADGTIAVRWAPLGTDSHAEIDATGLSRQDVERFANGLTLRDSSIDHPASPSDAFGFTATVLPGDLEEATSSGDDDVPARRVLAVRGDSTATLTVIGNGDAALDASINQPDGQDGIEHTTVMGHRAIVVTDPEDGSWFVAWQPRDRTTVELHVTGVDRAGLDALLTGFREVSDDEWGRLLRDHAG